MTPVRLLLRVLACRLLVAVLLASLSPTPSFSDSVGDSVAARRSNQPSYPSCEEETADTAVGGVVGVGASDILRPVVPWRERLGVGGSFGLSYLLPMDDECKAIMHNGNTYLFDLHAELRTSPTAANAYDAAFGYPSLQGGLLVADYADVRLWRAEPRLPYVSRMGCIVALYGSFLRDLYRSPRWRLGYKLGNGLGIAARPYRTGGNADNEVIGSRWNIFLNLGWYAKFSVSPHLEAFLGLDYIHFSNSALDRPNKGANNVGLTAGLTYFPMPQQPGQPVRRSHERYLARRFYVEVSAGWAGKTLQDEWVRYYWTDQPGDPRYRTSHYTIHHAFTALVAPMVRYSRRYASGLGLDYTYAAYASRLATLDADRGQTGYAYSRHVLGLTLRHEVFFRQLSLAMGLGVYLHRKMGYTADVDEKPYYETIGLRWNVPRTGGRLFLGYHVKAHFTKADCLQLYAGWRLGRSVKAATQRSKRRR